MEADSGHNEGKRTALASELSRRRLLAIGGTLAGWALMPQGRALAALQVALPRTRELRFYNLHTGERLSAVYCERGGYIKAALAEINYILRDFRANQVKPIDPRLLDLLYGLNRRLDTRQPFAVISGYRSPATNAMLAARSEGVAVHSLHMVGQAIDIRVPGRGLSELRRAATSLKLGGVGYYPASDFVHVDVGRVRYW
ncbi:MAG TPA: YcbK family protein [Candidatus Binataceae bacterium]|nr:YcbK family protein [Candidatus Binataceae bacterium]